MTSAQNQEQRKVGEQAVGEMIKTMEGVKSPKDLERYLQRLEAVAMKKTADAKNTPLDKIAPGEAEIYNRQIDDAFDNLMLETRKVSAITPEFQIAPMGGEIEKAKPTAQMPEFIIPVLPPNQTEAAKKQQELENAAKVEKELNAKYREAGQKGYPGILNFIQQIGAEGLTASENLKPLFEQKLYQAVKVLRENCEAERNRQIGSSDKSKKPDLTKNLLPPQYSELISAAILSLEKQFNSDMQRSIALKDTNDPDRRRMEDLEKEKIALYSLLDRDAVKNLAAMLGIKRSFMMDPKLKAEFNQILQNDPYRKALIQGPDGEISQLITKWQEEIKNAAAKGETQFEAKLKDNIKWAQEILTGA